MSNSKIALVTGGSKRIGRAISLRLAQLGFDVAIHFNTSEAAAREVATKVEEFGQRAVVLPADLSNDEQTAGLIPAANELFGTPLTLLVNNASLFEQDRWDNCEKAQWDAHHAVNLWAPFVLARAFAKQAPKTANVNIINLLDQRVRNLNPQFFSYTLTKAALWTMTQTLAQALAPDIRVNGIGPGPVLQSIHQDEAEFSQEAENTPLAVSVDPEDIADACAYLASATKVTGQMIAVDSGQHLSWKTPDITQP